jgi:hypothetical protein
MGLLKHVYVDVALDELGKTGKKPSTSRLSMFTGIHRKEIRRLVETPAGENVAPRSVLLGAQLVAHWTSDPRYLDEDGRPRPLRRHTDGDEDGGSRLRRITAPDPHPPPNFVREPGRDSHAPVQFARPRCCSVVVS